MRRFGLIILAAVGLVGLGGLAVACDGGGSSGTDCGNDICEDGEDFASCPADCPVCDNNGYCSVTGGENGLNCPGDCPLCVEDTICNREGGENGLNCPADCMVCLADGFCDAAAGETTENCSADCLLCNDDGVCDTAAGETPQNCLADCPVCVVDATCDTAAGETRQNCPADCPLCNDDGVCDTAEGEDSFSCPTDCVGFVDVCDLAAMQAGRAPHDYIVNEIYIPITSLEAGVIGTDLDGDGTIDNKLGSIMALLIANGSGDPNPMLNLDIDQGDLVVPLRLYVDAWTGDATTLLLSYEGEPTTSPPAFDGSDVVSVAAGSASDMFLCGPYVDGVADVGPGQLLVPMPLLSQTVFVPLRQAQVVGPVTATTWTNVMLGGGVTEADVDQVVLPGMLAYFNDVIAADPTSTIADTLMNMFDGNCVDLGGDCVGVVAGAGDCADNLPTDATPLSITELRCNALLSSALSSDVDSDGDGVDDLLSVGFRIQAVSATINIP
jgi:hypothetical protein